MFYTFLALVGAFLFERRHDHGRHLDAYIKALQKILIELRSGALQIDTDQTGLPGTRPMQLQAIVATINNQLARGQSVTPRLTTMVEWLRRFSQLAGERRRLWRLMFGRFVIASLIAVCGRISQQPEMTLWGSADERLLMMLAGGLALAVLMLFVKLLPTQLVAGDSPYAQDFWRSMLSLEPHATAGDTHTVLALFCQKEWQQGVSLAREKQQSLDEQAAQILAREKSTNDRCQDLIGLFELFGVGPFVVLLLCEPLFHGGGW